MHAMQCKTQTRWENPAVEQSCLPRCLGTQSKYLQQAILTNQSDDLGASLGRQTGQFLVISKRFHLLLVWPKRTLCFLTI